MENLSRALVVFVGVGSDEVEIELIEGGFGEEVAAIREGLQIKELVFDQAMDGLDIALVGVGRGRDALVLAVA